MLFRSNLIPVRNIPVTFMPPEAVPDDDGAESAPIPKAIPVRARVNGEGSSSSSKDKSKPARRRDDSPAKPKETPKNEGGGLLKHFRTA